MKLSTVARNILTEAAENPGGIRLTHSKTALLLEERGAIERSGEMVRITAAGMDLLSGNVKRRSRKQKTQKPAPEPVVEVETGPALDLLRRELIASRHEIIMLRREIEHLRTNSLLWISNLGVRK